ncbi:ribosomal RNA large subunit methyltransferase N [Bacteroides pyogenes JCM 10003]|nr:ribosomal RNA large subunit methyltransferase N [Bacteroides pyogenes JCM 10003]
MREVFVIVRPNFCSFTLQKSTLFPYICNINVKSKNRMSKYPLLGMTLAELQSVAKRLGMPGFAAKQIASWLYDKKVVSIDEMTNLSLKHRNLLKQNYEVGAMSPVDEMRSVDGTVKYLYRVGDHFVESVYIPDEDRATLCVSSQVGCKMNCRFCMTGKQGYTVSLTAHQIINQIHSLPERDKLTNVVMMGMGEPLDNLDELLKALDVLTASYGYAWSPKRITVSTVGLRKGLRRFIEESECHLAISLHSPVGRQRAELMPAEKAFPATEIVELLKNYDFSKQRRLSFEYIMFKGVNDSQVYAKELLKLLRGLDCRMNLIRFHAIPGVDLEGSDMETITRFRDYLTSHGLFTTIRASRGEDIFAACGMLSTAKQEKKNHINI